MARIELAPEVAEDLDRKLEHLLRDEVESAAARLHEIIEAVDVLQTNPLIGLPASNDKRELVIGRESQGDLVLYRYEGEIDTGFALAVRSRRDVQRHWYSLALNATRYCLCDSKWCHTRSTATV